MKEADRCWAAERAAGARQGSINYSAEGAATCSEDGGPANKADTYVSVAAPKLETTDPWRVWSAAASSPKIVSAREHGRPLEE